MADNLAVTYTTAAVVNSNVRTPNNGDSGGTVISRPPIRFSATTQRPLLGRVGDYNAAALRVQIVGQALPVIIPRIQTGQSNPNKTIYTVAVVATLNAAATAFYGGPVGGVTVARYENVVFTPENITEPVPATPLTKQDLSSTYYWVGSFGWMCLLFNAAYATAFDAVKMSLQGVGVGSLTAYPWPRSPVLERVAGGFRLGLNNSCYNVASGAIATTYGPWMALMNDAGFSLFNGFPALSIMPNATFGGGASPPVPDIYHVFSLLATAVATGPAPDYITTEFDCTDAWCPVTLIQVVSPTLPAVFETVFNPNVIANDGIVDSTSAQSAGAAVSSGSANVLVSFGFSLGGSAADLQGKITYTPNGQWKWVQLSGDQALTDQTWAVVWTDAINGESHPLTFNPGTTWAELECVYQRVA